MNWVEATAVWDSASQFNPNGATYTRKFALLTTRYQYDAAGNLTRRWDAKAASGLREWTYDGLDRVLTETDELGATDTYEYSEALLARVNRANRSTTQWVRDALGRDTLNRHTGGNFDIVSNRTQYNVAGYPVLEENAHGRIDRVFFGDGRVQQETQTNKLLGTARSLSYTYWPSGMRRTVTSPMGRVFTYTPAADNLLGSVTYTGTGGGPVIGTISFTYDARGRRSSVAYGGGPTTNWRYDVNGTLLHVHWANQEKGYFAENFDSAGRVTRYRQDNNAATYDYTSVRYDRAARWWSRDCSGITMTRWATV